MEMPLLPSLPPPSFCLSQVRQVVALYTRILLHFAQKFRPPGPTLYRHGVAYPAAPSPLASSPSLPIHYTTLYTIYDTIQDTIRRFSSVLSYLIILLGSCTPARTVTCGYSAADAPSPVSGMSSSTNLRPRRTKGKSLQMLFQYTVCPGSSYPT